MASSLIKSSARSSAANQQVGGLDARVLEAEFFSRHTVEVARDLLGKVLLVRIPRSGRIQAVRIIETEAYRAGDPASHSARGKTPRCSVMFGPPGRAYVYLIYGMYSMLNFVTEPENQPGAVLIRAVEPIFPSSVLRSKTNGPGRLTKALGIRRADDGISLQGPRLWVGDDGFEVGNVLCSGRVGISEGQNRLWRFFIEGNPHVSPVKENHGARRVEDGR